MTLVTNNVSQGVEVVYSTTITAIGEQVPAFLGAGMLILFGDSAPAELHPISVLHAVDVAESGPAPGDLIEVDGIFTSVLAVGHVVGDNLLNIGHMDIKSDGRRDATLPGDVCVPANSLVLPAVGDVLRILRPNERPASDDRRHDPPPEGES